MAFVTGCQSITPSASLAPPTGSQMPSGAPNPTIRPTPTAVSEQRAAWTRVADIPQPRDQGTATLLADGRVLVTGGRELFETAAGELGARSLASTAIYDATGDTWTVGPSLADARTGHSSLRLPDGRILVGGGYNESEQHEPTDVDSLEIFDSERQTWSTIAQLPARQGWETATLLLDGRVLVIGPARDGGPGRELASIFDPGSASWDPIGQADLVRVGHSAILLGDGTVLVAGGSRPDSELPDPVANAAVFDPAASEWRDIGPMPIPAFAPILALDRDGTVVVASSGLEYDPGARSWSTHGSVGDHTFEAWAQLGDGRLVALDGLGGTQIYDRAAATWRFVGAFKAISLVPFVTLADGRVLSSGGYRGCADVNPCADGEIAEAWIFDQATPG